MLINYLRIAFRYLLKNKAFSAINVFGLTLGFACFILIALYLHDELSFDMFHTNASRIYRVIQHEQMEDGTTRDVMTVSARLGPESAIQIPGIEGATRMFALGRLTMGNDPGDRDYEQMRTVDPNFFTIFSFPFIDGNPTTALQEPGTIILDETLAQKYFHNESPLGKRLWSNIEDRRTLTVMGVMNKFPASSHLQFDIAFSESTWNDTFPWYKDYMNNDWTSNGFVTYLLLEPGADVTAVEHGITDLIKGHYPADRPFKSSFRLQPMKDIHMYSSELQGDEANVNGIKPYYIYIFGAVAFLILLIACLNYMNLATAAALKRTREIGTRKTLGAYRGQLIAQFGGEAIIICSLAFIFAIAIVQVILPVVNAFAVKELSFRQLPITWLLGISTVMFLVGALSSLYPAYIIARVMPSEALRKEVKISRALPVRKVLVAVQFVISIMMIAATLIIYRQLNYMRSKDLGFKVNNLLVVDINSRRLRTDFENVKAEFSTVPGVEQVAASTRVPGEWKSFPISTVRVPGTPTGHEMIYVGIDKDFMKTYDIKLLEGRNSTDSRGDSSKVILTKFAAEQLGLTDAVGQTIEIPTVRWGGSVEPLTNPLRVEVIGIADDFHFESFRHRMMPIIFAYPNTSVQVIDYYTLNVQTSNWSETLEKLKAVNSRVDPDSPLEYTFLDGRFERFYEADERRGQIFLGFSAVIILIACLGLFALVSYSVETRMKEIGIRKVLGASVGSIVRLISLEFLVIVLLSGLVAFPASWFLMKSWLYDFAYQVTIGPEVYAAAGIAALLIAYATICLRAIRAAVINPVDSLRSE